MTVRNNAQEIMIKNLGGAAFRAWQVYLAGISESFETNAINIYRVYCKAV
jgi:cyclopropane fatty-acyl-phospholipid synthase-like methyltransferase